MYQLPDELLDRVLEIGIESSKLGYRELCCLSIASRRLNRLSSDPVLWSSLLAIDFPESDLSSSSSTSVKSVYRMRFELHRDRKMLARRRAVLMAESKVAVCRMKLESLRSSISEERTRLKEASEELSNLERARRASVALKLWQPEVIRGSQMQMVQQCIVPVDSRVRALEMEVKVCKKQLEIHKQAYNVERDKLNECKEAVESLMYHPTTQRCSSGSANDTDDDGSDAINQKKKKKRKT